MASSTTRADQRLWYYSAPAHRVRAIVEYLQHATPDFISPDLWPPNSPDLNPVDYKILGCLQDRVYQKRIRDVNQLKQHLVDVWSDFGQTVIDRAIDEWRMRLQACVRRTPFRTCLVHLSFFC